MSKHFSPDYGNQEEVTTEDGKYKYWRIALPLPLFTHSSLFRKNYECQCNKVFKSYEAYELHYRKAYTEEEHQITKELKEKLDSIKDLPPVKPSKNEQGA